MTTPLHIKFLELFKNRGIGQFVNIAPFITDHFTYDSKLDINNPINPASPVMFLQDLIYRNLIRSEGANEHDWIFSFKNGQFVPNLKNAETNSTLYFYITSKGLDYLEAYNNSEITNALNKSFKNVNEASLRNYLMQTRLSTLTFILAAVSAWMSWLSYNKTDETAKSVDKLREELRQWRSKKETPPVQITYPQVKPHK